MACQVLRLCRDLDRLGPQLNHKISRLPSHPKKLPVKTSTQGLSFQRVVRGGFSLLEILVAVAVLGLLVLMVSQLVQSGSTVISGSRKNLSADAQAREVFSRFALDVAQMAKRADMDAIFSDQDGNKKIFFYSESPGFASSSNNLSPISLVGYRVGANDGLERLGKGLPWSGAGHPAFLTYASTNSTTALPQSTLAGAWSSAVGASPTYDGVDTDYHPLAPGVFRFEYCFQKKDGSYTLTRDPSKGFRDVSAIVLSLAVLDGDSRKIAPDTSNLAEALPSPSASELTDDKLPAEIWQAKVNDYAAFSSSAGIPVAAAQRVRIYQRAFPLNMP
jgi:prepilin-type N-terminal cleavage/methylation domain-containing protein